MKAPVAITLIIMGALLVMVPALADDMHQRKLVELLSQTNVTSVNLINPMTKEYSFGCWLTGSGMVALAVFYSLPKNSTPPTEN